MKIWINAPFSAENVGLIMDAAGNCEIVFDESCADGAEIIVGNIGRLTGFSGLKLLQSTNAGVEKLLCKEIPESVTITNVTGAFGAVISEYIIGAILSMKRDLFYYRKNQQQHIWQNTGRGQLLSGADVLILGCGDIGKNTALRLRSFGARIKGMRRNPEPTEGFDSVYGAERLDSLLPEADIIICCLPHTQATEKMLGRRQFSLMKPGSLLVNVGRGSLTDTQAMVDALKEGQLGGAILDVFEQEPLAEDSPLWDMENVLITPHISGPSFGCFKQVERRIAEICADNISRFISGKPLRNVINRNTGYAQREE